MVGVGSASGYSGRLTHRRRSLKYRISSVRRSTSNVDLGIGCVTLFLLPFAAIGLFTAVMSVQRLKARNWTEALLFGVFALTFGGVGIGGIAAAIVGRGK